MGSSTGNLLVDDEPSLDRIVAAISRRAAFHSEDEDRLKARMGERKPAIRRATRYGAIHTPR